MAKTKVVSLRISIEDLAKGRDTLISIGIPPEELTTVSQIIKICFYYGIVAYNKSAKLPPSEESLHWIKQKFNQTKLTKSTSDIKLSDL